MTRNKITLGVIGGSGLDDPKILKDTKELILKTPYGSPADSLLSGKVGQTPVIILARHGRKHSLPPTRIPFRANLWALKEAGCTHLLATTACGSLREEMKPGDLVFPDQFIDLTKRRDLTFFEDKVLHTPMADPFDAGLRRQLALAAEKLKLVFHPEGTVITIEGPRFSTRAESRMFRAWKADVINMSTVPEVCLANELQIPYQSIAMVTDYDCWKAAEESVTFEMILERMKQNASKVKKLLLRTINNLR